MASVAPAVVLQGHFLGNDSFASGHRGHFVTVAGVVDVWPLAVTALPAPAGEGERREEERSQKHAASAEVKGQVVRLRPVKEPA